MSYRHFVAAAAVVAAIAGIVGCSDVEKTLNKGGDTSCREYLGMDDHDKRVTVTKALQQQSGSKDDPSGTSVDLGMSAVQLLCAVQANSETPIKNADVPGIFTPKPSR
ncbi:MAG: hypothetical protein HOQ24_02965 [Mycobacteriaceae bacterium]|nr:hypothetical protein [Mycobacteriaceae bacterium]